MPKWNMPAKEVKLTEEQLATWIEDRKNIQRGKFLRLSCPTGWTDEELKKIVKKFRRKYKVEPTVQQLSGGARKRLRFNAEDTAKLLSILRREKNKDTGGSNYDEQDIAFLERGL